MDNTATEPSQETKPKSRRRAAWAVLTILALTVLAAVIIPVALIMPFRAQSQRGLALSFGLRRWSPSLTLFAAVVAIALVVWLWSGSRWWRKAVLVVVLIPIFASAWFARQNHFEWMFNPLPNAVYAKISEANFVSDSDMLLAVENQGEAVAYPIRLMAYHHLVQDTVGGTPIVATY
jgi:uncharacterized SAM-binding protein YcdF (DUF218 family)